MNIDKSEIEQLINTKLETYGKKFGPEFKLAIIEIISLEKMFAPAIQQEKKSRLIPLSEWNNYHPYPTVRALRQYRNDSAENGFDEVLEFGGNNGGRILINEDKFFQWIENKRNKRG